ncbi:50S ribosomal protein L33 [Candidatus Dojkabacteria bacterium]|nr:50S ribosomal protein L33 [Candidatus Dojkabacteria bacterium]
MAKKGNRLVVLLECEKCKARNYSTVINRVNQREKKLKVKKHCKQCKSHTMHNMVKI